MGKKTKYELTPVKDLFAVYKNRLKAPEGSVIDAFVEVVSDVVGVDVPKEGIRYNPHTKTITITGRAVLRSEIQKRKIEIITHLKGRLGAKNAPETIL